MRYRDLTIIIPTLNEAENIGELLRIVKRRYAGAKTIVADDGSTDGTQKIAGKKKAKILDRSNRNKHGLTASVLEAASTAKTKFFVVIDGDLQHPPGKIAEIAAKLREGKKVVIAERESVEGKWPLDRRMMSVFATALARLRLMRWVNDPMSGFFGAETTYFNEVASRNRNRFEPGGYKVLFDFLKCSRAVTGSVSYTFYERRGGASKIRVKHAALFLRSLLR